jgi:adenylylsulfate kinase-like enzyme
MPRGSSLPIAWFCGPPGVGKTTLGWAVYQRLRSAGVRACYVDADQVGMCQPESANDPGWHVMKTRNVAALRENFEAAGAIRFVVSGVVDPVRGPGRDVVGDPLTVVRMTVNDAGLTTRLDGRRGSFGRTPDAIPLARLLDESDFADRCLDTCNRPVSELADEVLGWIADEPLAVPTAPASASAALIRPPNSAVGEVLLVCGPPGVGKSTVGFQVYLQLAGMERSAAYLDADQLAFFDSDTDVLRAANLAAVWGNYFDVGVQHLVVVARIDDEDQEATYRHAFETARLTVCRLAVSDAELVARVLSRGEGGSWVQPGDPLVGTTPDELMLLARTSATTAARLEANGIGQRVDVGGLSAETAASLILDRHWHLHRTQ